MTKKLSYTLNSNYRPDIDGLRAVAVTAVILGHFFPDVFVGGFIGVDIFFVISGFLISSVIYRGLENQTFSFIDFYAKRTRRIFPALITVLVAGLLLGALFLTPHEYQEMGNGGIYGSVFLGNFRLSRGVNYFDMEIARRPFMHLWSLGIEEQFYLLFPLLLFLGWKFLRGRVLLILLALIALSFYAGHYYLYQNYNESKAYFLPQCRFWQLISGAALAYVFFKSNENKWFAIFTNFCKLKAKILSVLGCIGIVFCLFKVSGASGNYPGYWAIVPTLSALALIASESKCMSSFIASKPCVYVGWLSYPMYLWHWVLLSIAYNLYAGEIPVGAKIGLIVVTLLFSYVTFNYIELQVRAKKASVKLMSILIALLLVICGACYLVDQTKGIPQRLPKDLQTKLALISSNKYEIPPQYRCESKEGFDCATQHGQEQGNIIFVGNSHTQHLMYELMLHSPKEFSVDAVASGGSLPIRGRSRSNSSKDKKRDNQVEGMLNRVIASPALWVVVSNTWRVNEKSLIRMRGGIYRNVEEVFGNTLDEIIRSGKRVILLIDTPHMPVEMDACMKLRPFTFVDASCSISRSEYEIQSRWQKKFFTEYASKHPKQVFVVNAAEAFCDDKACHMLGKNGEPLFSDTSHLGSFGSARYVKRIWEEILKIVQNEDMQ